MNTYDKQAAYQAVMTHIRDVMQIPPNRGPQSWLAKQLKVSRQLVYIWQEKGIPDDYAEKIAELLDMNPVQVCPNLGMHYLPLEVFDAILRSKKPFHVRQLELICLGLKREQRPTMPIKRTITKLEQPMKPIGGFIPISAEELANQREEAIKAGADLSIRGRRK